MAGSVPPGWHSVNPRLVVQDPHGLVTFLRDAFGASGAYETGRPTVLQIGDSIVMISDTSARRATNALLYLYVDDADATYDRALAAGATSIEAPTDTPYGDRRAMITDPCGNDWQIATYRGE
jgi:PhnB protein